MNLRVVLVNAPGEFLEEEYLEPPLGLLSIASYLQEHAGLRPVILDLTNCSADQALSLAAQTPADIVGFTVYCTKWAATQRLIATFVDRPNPPLIVVGGPNPTVLPEETLRFAPVDVVIRGEGEAAFLDLVREYSAGRLTRGRKQVLTGRPLQSDEFPILDRSFVPPPESYRRRLLGQPVVTLEASRGCRNHCIFCNSVVLGGKHNGGVVPKAVPKVLCEIDAAVQAGYRMFRFNDDSFVYAARVSGLLEALTARQIRYRIFANAADLTPENVERLKASGCVHISVGVESYNPANQAQIGKQTSCEQLRAGINCAAAAGIVVRAFFIVGLPEDRAENIPHFMERTAAELDFREYCIYPLIPYPGTEVWERPQRYGYTVLDQDYNHYVQIGRDRQSAKVLQHRNFGPAEVTQWIEAAGAIFDRSGKIHSSQSEFV